MTLGFAAPTFCTSRLKKPDIVPLPPSQRNDLHSLSRVTSSCSWRCVWVWLFEMHFWAKIWHLKFTPSNLRRVDLNPRISKICASWMQYDSVKYFSKLCFGTIEIQPELKYFKPILEDFTSWFQRAKAWEHEFGCVPSISFTFTGSKMARICKVIYYQ